MLIAVLGNLPQLALGLCWTTVVFLGGRRFERWKSGRRLSER
ncbi:hypothetical protein OSH11_13830 [Kaistia dalseonensis]|uniref:Uncharacterized protein n=1 Tax=Kaistia dalseonensis TaxID=410840 RepID=A0ABU0H7Y8_9HYPH|nr:hypothetical protein [Kaistia dalseonensis]MCX5495789.1 hypothetical protein [Kaistia dalseonensis]MDQ0438390.1 hypothetical protein [Kaistia dalseonensis]